MNYIEIKVKRNTKTGRLILIDRRTGIAFTSFDKTNEMYDFFTLFYKDSIEDLTPSRV